MRCFISPERAPLRDVPESLRPREVQRFAQEAEALGIRLTGSGIDEQTGVPFIDIDISAMPKRSLEYRGQLVGFLNDTMNADRIDCQPGDVLALTGSGQHTAASFNIASSLRDQVPDYSYALTEITPDELFSEAVPSAIDLAFDSTGGIREEQSADEQFMRAQVNQIHAEEAARYGVELGPQDDLWEAYDSRNQAVERIPMWDSDSEVQTFKDPFNSGGF